MERDRPLARSAHPRGHLGALAAVALAVALFVGAGAPVGAAAKPPGDLIGPGAALVVYSGGPLVTGASGRYATRAPGAIAEIRRLVNALPLYSPPPVCPDDLMIPAVVTFVRASGAVIARVSFQLGGCPSATVYRGGRAVEPRLGGRDLGATLSRIRALVVGAPTTQGG